MGPFSRFRVDQRENATILHLQDTLLLDRQVLNELQDELADFIAANQPEHLLVDFGSVQRFGTEAVNALLKARRLVAAYGGAMRLCDMDKSVQEIFKILRLDGDVFKIFPSTADALATIG